MAPLTWKYSVVEELVIFDPSKFYRWEDDARISLMRVLR